MMQLEKRLMEAHRLCPHLSEVEIIGIELIAVNESINRKWDILDDFCNSWSQRVWQDWKDSMDGEIAYRTYLLIQFDQYKPWFH